MASKLIAYGLVAADYSRQVKIIDEKIKQVVIRQQSPIKQPSTLLKVADKAW